MIQLLLAATIAGSIPAAVEKTLQLAADDPAVLQSRLNELEARIGRNERIRDSLVSCISESLIATGGDLLTTGLGWEKCPECKEANPLGLNSDSRTGLKFGQTGAEVGLCLLSAKKQHGGAELGTRPGKWVARILRWSIVANNLYAAISGKPLVRWGVK